MRRSASITLITAGLLVVSTVTLIVWRQSVPTDPISEIALGAGPRLQKLDSLPAHLGQVPLKDNVSSTFVREAAPIKSGTTCVSATQAESTITATVIHPSLDEKSRPTSTLPSTPQQIGTKPRVEELNFTTGSVEAPNPDQKTVAARIQQFGKAARARMAGHFRKAGVSYPPDRILLVACKAEMLLKVYGSSDARRQRSKRLRFICQYPIAAADNEPGPKLKEGDFKTPEGSYRIVALNPESSYHLSMGLNYPNHFDLLQAKRDGRANPGFDIFIHGNCYSDGCLAMGNTAATDLFVLASDTGLGNIEVILSPLDFRVAQLPDANRKPEWIKNLYKEILARLSQLDDGMSTQASLIRYRDTIRPAQ